MTEERQARLKRMSMRSWRRGTKEMDLILGPYADAHLAHMSDATLALYDTLLAQNDQDLYPIMTGVQPAPAPLAALAAEIAAFARNRRRAR